ncbi:MAG: hypothetical protein ACFB00_05295 [Parvularculaceae bacterium]
MSEKAVDASVHVDKIDPGDHRRTYQAVMRASAEVGVPFVLALTMFFTNLVMANGLAVALIAAVATYLFVFFVVKAFFSH